MRRAKKMEAALLVREEEAVGFDAMAIAAKILSGEELADYTHWNAPHVSRPAQSARRLRRQRGRIRGHPAMAGRGRF